LKKIAIVLGTRPEIIKLAELIRILKKKKKVKTFLVFTGQHYDYNLCQVFMEELKLPKLDINFGISGKPKEQIKKMVSALIAFFEEKEIDTVVAEGDTNSVLAAAIASLCSEARFAHVEAGLRSFDLRMPEEWNRMLADDVSYYAFAPTRLAVKHLKGSAARPEGVFLTGNTIVEAVRKNLKRAGKSKILETLGLERGKYAVLTAHRQEYVDTRKNILELIKALKEIPVEIVFPLHPRTRKMLKKFGLMGKMRAVKNLKIIESLGYFDFLKLASSSVFLLSDSGGIQEEASVYKKYVIVLRDSTERPEILGKFGELTGYNAKKIVKAAKRAIRGKRNLKKAACPFGDGKASARIAKILVKGA
jgi:UDP-N-acetylglucosamine 2-epimerase (non-hydrolysing)